MTTLLAPARNPKPEAMLSGPRYSLLVSADREHREAAQRLRYRVFAAEPGFRLPAGMPPGIDADRFDEYCDHLLVRENRTGAVVGCYRMLPPDAARAAGGYYTATEFDLTALDPDGLRAVEMGRACVDPAHRSGSVLSLMWAGILRYLQLTGHNWVMGCVSVPIRTHPADVPGA
ncbi:GNAT family N-acetyltransferase, partial [Rhodococcus rhodochrous]